MQVFKVILEIETC